METNKFLFLYKIIKFLLSIISFLAFILIVTILSLNTMGNLAKFNWVYITSAAAIMILSIIYFHSIKKYAKKIGDAESLRDKETSRVEKQLKEYLERHKTLQLEINKILEK